MQVGRKAYAEWFKVPVELEGQASGYGVWVHIDTEGSGPLDPCSFRCCVT